MTEAKENNGILQRSLTCHVQVDLNGEGCIYQIIVEDIRQVFQLSTLIYVQFDLRLVSSAV